MEDLNQPMASNRPPKFIIHPDRFFQGDVPLARNGVATDSIYTFNRDHESRQDVRDNLEFMWRRFRPLCPDLHFLNEARHHFVERTWELYLAHVLLDFGFPLEQAAPEGPDLRFVRNGVRHWVEAIAANRGQGTDQVPEPPTHHPFQWDHRPALLRMTAAIEEKHRKYRQYHDKGIVEPGEPFVIAVNTSMIPLADIEPDGVPSAAKMLLGIGDPVFVATVGQIDVQITRPRRRNIAKRNGELILTEGFLAPEYAGISAVIFQALNIINPPRPPRRFGDDLITLHNPNASNPVPRGLFPFGFEYWIENQHLQRTDHRPPRLG